MTTPPDFEIAPGGAVALPQPHTVSIARKTPSRLFWDRFKQDKAAVLGGIVIIILVGLAIFGGAIASWITGHGQNQVFSNMTDAYGVPRGPNSQFWFGADADGTRSLRARHVRRAHLAARRHRRVGNRRCHRTVVGLIAGFFGGVADTVLSRSADVLLAVPQILIAIGIVAACSTTKDGCLGGTRTARAWGS